MHTPARAKLKRSMPSALFHLISAFRAHFIPDEGEKDFWDKIDAKTHERAVLDNTFTLLLKSTVHFLPDKELSGHPYLAMQCLKKGLADEQLTDEMLAEVQAMYNETTTKRYNAEKAFNHLKKGEDFAKILSGLSKIAKGYDITLTVQQPEIRDDLRRFDDRTALCIQITNLNLQICWIALSLNALEALKAKNSARYQNRDRSNHLMKSIASLLDVHAGIFDPSRADWTTAYTSTIMSTLDGAAVPAAEHIA